MKGFLACLAAACVLAPSASAVVVTAPAALPKGQLSVPAGHGPTGLHGFAQRVNESVPADHTYTDIPAFAWNPVRGASTYEIQLATSRSFSDSTMLLDDATVRTPVTSLQIQLPWMTGEPYALWVRVRAAVGRRITRWSSPWGFDTSWQTLPQQLNAPNGLVRWTPIAGATAYEVWYTDIGIRVRTLTNVADEREYWALHPNNARSIHWRVRALRYVAKTALPNKIQVISYGPYSPPFTSTNKTTIRPGQLVATNAISDVTSTSSRFRSNSLMPGFTWSGTMVGGLTSNIGLYRVYVFSDKECINSVTVGSLVGGPAWAPRWAPPLQFPGTEADLAAFSAGTVPLAYGGQANAQMPDGTKIVTAEEVAGSASSSGSSGSSGASGASGSSSGSSSGSGSTTTSSGSDPSFTTDPGTVALPDNGRYWWTVIPVNAYADANGNITYQDAELAQDACRQNGAQPVSMSAFGMRSEPVTTTRSSPLASGLLGGRVVAASSKQPSFEQLPVVTWTAVYGAQSYEIELSRKSYPWRTAVAQTSLVPSATLNLTKRQAGLWYYRVRGVNGNLPGSAINMTWSRPTPIRISGDVFKIVK